MGEYSFEYKKHDICIVRYCDRFWMFIEPLCDCFGVGFFRQRQKVIDISTDSAYVYIPKNDGTTSRDRFAIDINNLHEWFSHLLRNSNRKNIVDFIIAFSKFCHDNAFPINEETIDQLNRFANEQLPKCAGVVDSDIVPCELDNWNKFYFNDCRFYYFTVNDEFYLDLETVCCFLGIDFRNQSKKIMRLKESREVYFRSNKARFLVNFDSCEEWFDDIVNIRRGCCTKSSRIKLIGIRDKFLHVLKSIKFPSHDECVDSGSSDSSDSNGSNGSNIVERCDASMNIDFGEFESIINERLKRFEDDISEKLDRIIDMLHSFSNEDVSFSKRLISDNNKSNGE